MGQEKKYDVFISYSRKDSTIADEICEAFGRVGITYFIDRKGIGGGNEFPLELATSILNSQVFLLLGSKNSYESSLTSITIPNSVKSMGDWAFNGCSSLESVKIPKALTNIGYHAFPKRTKVIHF